MNSFFSQRTRAQLIKYCVIGGFNTTIGLLCIFILIWLGVSVYLANFIVYFVGFFMSYLLNTKYTFEQRYSTHRAIKFYIGIIISYIINILCVYAVLSFYSDAKYLSQIVGVFFYTTSGFIINKLWALK